MKTGIVVDNYDPLYKGRCKIRVFGLHSETICGQYLILDDDLPWSSPAPNIGSSNGTFNIPSIGERVYVNADDPYNILYYGQVEVKSSIKDLQYKNTEMSDKLKVIAYSEDNIEGEKNCLKIYYLPEDGLTIECNGNSILLTKYDNLLIKNNRGAEISLDNVSGDIKLKTESKVILDCNEVSFGEDAAETIVLGNKLMEKFNSHTHFTGGDTGTTNPPIEKLQPGDFSKKIKIK
jgi:hypothetical protein